MQRIRKVLSYIKHHKRITLFIAIPIIILALIFWPRPPKPIETEKVTKGNVIESITATGTVNAANVNLTFLTGGTLAYVGVKEGSQVKAGQTIATLDQRTVQKNLEDKLKDFAKQRNTFNQTKEDNKDEPLTDEMDRVLQNNQYDLDKAVLSVELQDLARQQSVLTTPINGVVTRADATVTGVNIPVTTTYTVADFSKSKLDIDLDEADIGKIAVGQSVKITFDAYPNKPFTATVTSIDYASHTTSTGGTAYTVEVSLPDSHDFVYRLGMNADAEIILEQKHNVLVVSLASLTDDNSVYVQKGNNFEKRKIRTGIQSDTDIEILGGLTEGETVALQPDEAEKRVKK